ncbi:stigma-specific STIG1-like protein 3 [Phragmites australis]|uniref:stigma-specific STIG1-like protein 3 n=1 Tax=Phragmites australis TaxID=29695 RepID=UPI002D79B448|nr:stigma-specific STIG1-like protein 3 [Phragmites australis]
MAKLTVLLLVALAAVTISMASAAVSPTIQARRSRFLLANNAVHNPPLPSYDCSKKSAAVCLAPGSPGPTCCGGQCVDTLASADHCGGCNKTCKHGRTCCGGRCVDLLSDKDNCGKCYNQCDKKCNYGFCDYAL